MNYLNEIEDEISAINIDFNHNNTLLEEENKKLAPLRDRKMESVASLQKLNLDMTSLIEEEARVKSLQEKLEKSIKTVESDLEREKSISLDADLNEKRISKEKEDLLNTENKLSNLELNSSKELQISKTELNKLQTQLDNMLDQIEVDIDSNKKLSKETLKELSDHCHQQMQQHIAELDKQVAQQKD